MTCKPCIRTATRDASRGLGAQLLTESSKAHGLRRCDPVLLGLQQSQSIVLSHNLAQHGGSLLALATASGDLQLLQLLVKRGVHVQPHTGTLLREACARNHAHVAAWLIEYLGADIRYRNDAPLYAAAARGSAEALGVLFQHGACIKKAIEPCLRSRCPGPMLQQLFLHGLDPTVWGPRLVYMALMEGNDQALQSLLNYPQVCSAALSSSHSVPAGDGGTHMPRHSSAQCVAAASASGTATEHATTAQQHNNGVRSTTLDNGAAISAMQVDMDLDASSDPAIASGASSGLYSQTRHAHTVIRFHPPQHHPSDTQHRQPPAQPPLNTACSSQPPDILNSIGSSRSHSPLLLAAHLGRWAAVRILLQHGAAPTHEDMCAALCMLVRLGAPAAAIKDTLSFMQQQLLLQNQTQTQAVQRSSAEHHGSSSMSTMPTAAVAAAVAAGRDEQLSCRAPEAQPVAAARPTRASTTSTIAAACTDALVVAVISAAAAADGDGDWGGSADPQGSPTAVIELLLHHGADPAAAVTVVEGASVLPTAPPPAQNAPQPSTAMNLSTQEGLINRAYGGCSSAAHASTPSCKALAAVYAVLPCTWGDGAASGRQAVAIRPPQLRRRHRQQQREGPCSSSSSSPYSMCHHAPSTPTTTTIATTASAATAAVISAPDRDLQAATLGATSKQGPVLPFRPGRCHLLTLAANMGQPRLARQLLQALALTRHPLLASVVDEAYKEASRLGLAVLDALEREL